ncbi:MAG: hypothetical protein SGBAC_001273 [Bacillariaceae sp.]
MKKFAAEHKDFNWSELPKYAYLRNVVPEERPEVIGKIMASGDEAKIQESKDKELGPYGTPKYVMEAVARFRSGNSKTIPIDYSKAVYLPPSKQYTCAADEFQIIADKLEEQKFEMLT